MKRSSLIEGGAKLRMSVPTTEGISNNIGTARDVKCIKPQVTQTRLDERHARTASVDG